MLSYKEYKILQESFGGPLGLSQMPTVGGVVGSHGVSGTEIQLETEIEELERLLEAKKKAKKKMLDLGGDDDGGADLDGDGDTDIKLGGGDDDGCPSDDDDDDDDDDDGDDMGDIALAKKKAKKKAKKESVDDVIKNARNLTSNAFQECYSVTQDGYVDGATLKEDADTLEKRLAELNDLVEAKMKKKMKKMDMDMDMDMDDDDDDGDDDGGGDDGCPSDDDGDDMGDISLAKKKAKKKAKKNMNESRNFSEEERARNPMATAERWGRKDNPYKSSRDEDDDYDDEDNSDKRYHGDNYDGMKKKGKKKAKKKMTAENQEFLKSVNSMLNAPAEPKSWDGISKLKEDALLPPNDPNNGLADQGPGPGEVGYSPDTRVGWGA